MGNFLYHCGNIPKMKEISVEFFLKKTLQKYFKNTTEKKMLQKYIHLTTTSILIIMLIDLILVYM